MNAPIPYGLNGHDSAAGIMAERRALQAVADDDAQADADYETGKIEAANILSYSAFDGVIDWQMMDNDTCAQRFDALIQDAMKKRAGQPVTDGDIATGLNMLLDSMIEIHAQHRREAGFGKPAMFRRPQ